MDRDSIECWLTDMDGVLVKENNPLPGAAELLAQWRQADVPYLVLTNNSIYTARDLSARLRSNGLDVPETKIWTSAMATDRKSTRLNSSHVAISYAVFCLKKKKIISMIN